MYEVNQKDAFDVVLQSIASTFSGVHMDVIDIGGGINIDTLERLSALLKDVLSSVGAKRIIIEPGRHLVDPCIEMSVSIIAIKEVFNNRLIFINSGIYSGLLDVILKQKRFEIIDPNHSEHSILKDTIICGSSSDVSDMIGVYMIRNDIKVGDRLIIKNCGAYSAVMQTNFYGRKSIRMVVSK
jgi:diaminopimelate decarboxylase